MIAEIASSERIAARLLVRFGVPVIWDAHLAAAATYSLGQVDVADEITEIAKAAEREWQRCDAADKRRAAQDWRPERP